ncbi:L-arabinose isomerase [Dyadobacter sp. BE34]|uniref:L-arabinose isomerase n=1 Tax=Dyadobacter fermentans TaxID=94254 RepID=A0ABU1QUH7_9BACT|nr:MULTISPECIES: L-fucose/L-arabinose isomerase family protein [Dyadobacter]MDR6804809.1 L-arabinose isomerase [Dyadobacter fermentans]MDR7043432.1 L-arabinose isomerase [Dyadobacter sp. BE242]MDR7197744.1 L-arabinose isomerase [Dyadobacter sp. BE34]MDR7214823.1 L-arabinose isomerase [Dyadobacter sp. BE31]MDR7262358.1 L-arabinose isomerase [Dyadobacter sp. BE32]
MGNTLQSENHQVREAIIQKRQPTRPRIGVFGVGYFKYWSQFDGLLDDMLRKQEVFIEKIRGSADVELVDFGLVDDVQKAYELVPKLHAANLDLIFCDMLTYATSNTFGTIIRNLNVPIVLVALQPDKAMDYTRASTYMQLYNDDICSLPEFAGVAARMGKKVPDMIIGTLHDDPQADAEIREYCRIAAVLHDVRTSRIGHIGHPIEAMLDMHSDSTMFTAHFGAHIVQCEAHEIVTHYQNADRADIEHMKERILDFFDTPDPVSDPISEKLRDSDLETAARVTVALEKFVEAKQLDGLAYYYEGPDNSETRTVMSNLIVGNSLLTGAGFPMCGESDLKTCFAMLIMERLGIGGSFAEFHPVDFKEGFVLVGHDGPHNVAIAEGKPVLRSLTKYHGKPGFGAGVEFKIKEGPITMLSINSTYDGKFKFVIAEGQSVEGPIPPTGNTNTRGFFKPDVRTFLQRWMKEGPTHHFALGVGHHASAIAKIAGYLNLEAVIIRED